MLKPGSIPILLVVLIALSAWREYSTSRQLANIARSVDTLRANSAADTPNLTNLLTSSQTNALALRAVVEEQNERLEKLVQLESAKSPPSLAQLRAAKPELDAAAVEEALKTVDPTGRVRSVEFLSQHETLQRFGAPSVTLTKEGVVTWIYKLEGFEHMMRCEFVDGVMIAAYDR